VYGCSSFVLAKKLNFLKSKLKEWNRDVFGHLDTKLGALIDKIKVFDAKEQLQSLYWAERFERLEVKKEISLVRKWLDTFWRQRAKQQWILEGDRNTKFSHRVANFRRQFKAIQSICVDGVCLDDVSSMKGVIINFYNELYREDQRGRPFEGLSYDTISDEDASDLLKEFGKPLTICKEKAPGQVVSILLSSSIVGVLLGGYGFIFGVPLQRWF